MSKKHILRVVFSMLALGIVAGAIILDQKGLKADDNKSRPTPKVFTEFFPSGGGWLGIELEEVTAENMSRYHLNEESGAIVKKVEKDSPADKAGLRENDVILTYAGTPVFSASQFSRLIRETPANRTVSLGILRDGSQQVLPIKLGERAGHGFGGYQFKFPDDWEKFGKGEFIKPLLRERGEFRSFFNRPRLGITLEDLTDQMAAYFGVKDGILVTSVTDNSPAAKAGLRAGDVITAVDNKEVTGGAELMRILRDKEEGGPVALTIVRDKRTLTVTVNLEKVEKPAPGKRTRGQRL